LACIVLLFHLLEVTKFLVKRLVGYTNQFQPILSPNYDGAV